MRHIMGRDNVLPITFNFDNQLVVGSATKNPDGSITFTIRSNELISLMSSEDEGLIGLSFVTMPKKSKSNDRDERLKHEDVQNIFQNRGQDVRESGW